MERREGQDSKTQIFMLEITQQTLKTLKGDFTQNLEASVVPQSQQRLGLTKLLLWGLCWDYFCFLFLFKIHVCGSISGPDSCGVQELLAASYLAPQVKVCIKFFDSITFFPSVAGRSQGFNIPFVSSYSNKRQPV